MRLRARVQMMIGVARSLRTYYGSPSHLRRMKAFYAEITKPGDLVFDIGAHVGDRVWAFRSLGCKVVAMEPQTALVVCFATDSRSKPQRGDCPGRDLGHGRVDPASRQLAQSNRFHSIVVFCRSSSGWSGRLARSNLGPNY